MMEPSLAEEYPLPGAYNMIPNGERFAKNQYPSTTLSLDLFSSVLFPGYPESMMNVRRRNNRWSLPGAWVGDNEADICLLSRSRSFSHACSKDKEMNDTAHPVSTLLPNEIREAQEAVDQLRKETSQLEETDVIVKRSIQIVARKIFIAQCKRRRCSPWDWCDESEDEHDDDDDLVRAEENENEDLDWEII